MYPHVTQFETRDAELRDRLRLERERREAQEATQGRPRPGGHRRLRTLLATLVRSG